MVNSEGLVLDAPADPCPPITGISPSISPAAVAVGLRYSGCRGYHSRCKGVRPGRPWPDSDDLT